MELNKTINVDAETKERFNEMAKSKGMFHYTFLILLMDMYEKTMGYDDECDEGDNDE
jgi:hypothetical protein